MVTSWNSEEYSKRQADRSCTLPHLKYTIILSLIFTFQWYLSYS